MTLACMGCILVYADISVRSDLLSSIWENMDLQSNLTTKVSDAWEMCVCDVMRGTIILPAAWLVLGVYALRSEKVCVLRYLLSLQ
jgi:hypothetical protein